MPDMAALPKHHPLMVAWEAYKETEEYVNSKKWASAQYKDRHLEGSLWAMFMAGWQAHRSAVLMLT